MDLECALDIGDLHRLQSETKNAEVAAFLQREIDKLLGKPGSSGAAHEAAPADSVLRGLLSSGDEAGPKPEAQAKPLHKAVGTTPATPAAKPAAAPAAKPAPAPAPAAAEDAESEGADSDEGAASDPEEVLVQQERLEERMARFRRSRGMSHDSTLKATFKLLDCLIGQYKLNKTDAILAEIGAVCKERGSDWYVKWIQSLAFCRWKQHKYKEALTLFHEQEGIVGASAALCENIGHTYSSMGDLKKAEEYFAPRRVERAAAPG